jgi:hypothetical protein
MQAIGTAKLTTETQRHREEIEKDQSDTNISKFSLCLCVSVVKAF